MVLNFWIHHHWKSGELVQGQYPDIMDTCRYAKKAFVNDTLLVPGLIFPVPFYPDDSNTPSSYSAFNSSPVRPPSFCLVCKYDLLLYVSLGSYFVDFLPD